MELEWILLLGQAMASGLLAAWLSTGVYENIRFPILNETLTAQVLSMERMAEDYPDLFAKLGHRAITHRGLQRWAFRCVVIAETIAFALLCLGTGALVGALCGWTSPDTAQAWGLLGAVAFTAVWGAFLVGGNYFVYWMCHDGAQVTHFFMTLWGMATMILLAL